MEEGRDRQKGRPGEEWETGKEYRPNKKGKE